jgi:hypothetical protein
MQKFITSSAKVVGTNRNYHLVALTLTKSLPTLMQITLNTDFTSAKKRQSLYMQTFIVGTLKVNVLLMEAI